MAVASINSNIHAQYASLGIRQGLDIAKESTINLSTGMKAAKDDPAGNAIGTGLLTDANTLKASANTASQAQSILAIADGGLDSISKIMTKLKSLASSANNASLGVTELGYIKAEMDALVSQVDSTVNTTKFNGQVLLDGTYASKNFQVGLASTDVITVSLSNSSSSGLGISSIDVTSDVAGANTAIDAAVSSLKGFRATLGSSQLRFGVASAGLETSIQNVTAASSEYLDADIASESIAFTLAQTKIQTAVSVTASVLQLPQMMLKLVG